MNGTYTTKTGGVHNAIRGCFKKGRERLDRGYEKNQRKHFVDDIVIAASMASACLQPKRSVLPALHVNGLKVMQA